jgi:hypothetical protein
MMYDTLFYSQRHDIVKKRIDAHDNVIETRQDGIGAPKVSCTILRHLLQCIFLHVLNQINTYFHQHHFFFLVCFEMIGKYAIHHPHEMDPIISLSSPF